MRNKISAIIVDADYQKHDYSQVKTDSANDYAEKYFELKILETTSGIIHEIYKFRGVDAIITIGDESIWGDLAYLPYSIRKKWTHINTFDPKQVASNIVNTFLGNIERHDAPLQFSFFTCTYNTDEYKLNRLYSSLCNQTYKEWDWFIIDDSPNEDTVNLIESLEDPRITVIKNHSIHGNIGFNKHTVAMMCDGDFLCEVDHDDELTPDCLERLVGATERSSKPLDMVVGNYVFDGPELGCPHIAVDREFLNGREYIKAYCKEQIYPMDSLRRSPYKSY